MRILGIDYGTVRCGIALSDPMGWTAQGLKTLDATSVKKLTKTILELVNEYDVETIVIGYPLNLNGSKSKKTEEVEQFVQKISNVLLSNKRGNVKIELQDERLTTVSSNKLMNELNVKKDNKRNIVDTLAASYILQAYLDKKK